MTDRLAEIKTGGPEHYGREDIIWLIAEVDELRRQNALYNRTFWDIKNMSKDLGGMDGEDG